MDCYIVLTFLCLFIAQTSCGPVRGVRHTRARTLAIQELLKDIQDTLTLMTDSLSTPCTSYNFSSQLGEGQVTEQNYASFGCLTHNMSTLIQKSLSPYLQNISQVAQSLARPIECSDCCSAPSFSEARERSLYVKCLLQSVEERITKDTPA